MTPWYDLADEDVFKVGAIFNGDTEVPVETCGKKECDPELPIIGEGGSFPIFAGSYRHAYYAIGITIANYVGTGAQLLNISVIPEDDPSADRQRIKVRVNLRHV